MLNVIDEAAVRTDNEKDTSAAPISIAGKVNRAVQNIPAAGKNVPQETKERKEIVSTGREKRIPDKEDTRSRKGE